MDRLTHRLEDQCGNPTDSIILEPYMRYEEVCTKKKILNRLAEYEETGLTPKEIEQMKARMPLHQWGGESIDKMSIFGVPVKKIIEMTDAEKQDKIIILPCKIGTKIYRIVPDLSVTWPDPVEYKVIWDRFKVDDIYNFGKTVFLNEEEAKTISKIK